jgi:pyruvate-ferredoxin/flavodoxin oxidoreductase
VADGQKVGLVKVRLYRPFSVTALFEALPQTTRKIAVLDRTKEPGSIGEPLYLDICAALRQAPPASALAASNPAVVGGRYGLSSKEFTPAMVKAVFDNLLAPLPKDGFTVGIVDDVTGTSLDPDPDFGLEPYDVHRAVFFGLGSDGTVGANKNSIKIIGEETDFYAQGYFVYDSKKSGAMTISHLRFGPRPVRSAYLVSHAGFVACHQFSFLEKYNVLEYAAPGAVFLVNASLPPEDVWDELPRETQQEIIRKKIRLYAIDAYRVAHEAGMGRRINTVMPDLFLRHFGRVAARGGHHEDQERDPQDLRPQGGAHRLCELRRGRQDARESS